MKINFYKNGGLKVEFLKSPQDYKGPAADWLLNHSSFKAENAQVFFMPYPEESCAFLVGCNEDFSLDDMRLSFFRIGKLMQVYKEKVLEVKMPLMAFCQKDLLAASVEGLIQSGYSYSLKSDFEKEDFDIEINYTPAKEGKEAIMQAVYDETVNLMEGVFLTRDLVNETSNTMTPEKLSISAKTKLEELGVKVKIYEENDLEEMGFKALLSVSKASENKPRLIVMEYKGVGAPQEKTGLVGKGLCYDSGGYSIKTARGMASMHCDMAGAATVIGAIYALAKNKAPANVVGLVGACENMIDGRAMRTGDIIGSLSGKTIEVLNTDAEGRLTLADVVYYACHYKNVDRLIDLATLTGAALVALGENTTAALTNNDDFYNEFVDACDRSGEAVWLLPNKEVYRQMNKTSQVADLINSPGPHAGTITAGLFVSEFLEGDVDWIHLDIAGTAYREKACDYLPERASGYHVKSIYNLFAEKKSC